jgi:hypothetical protein
LANALNFVSIHHIWFKPIPIQIKFILKPNQLSSTKTFKNTTKSALPTINKSRRSPIAPQLASLSSLYDPIHFFYCPIDRQSQFHNIHRHKKKFAEAKQITPSTPYTTSNALTTHRHHHEPAGLNHRLP